MKHQQGNKKIYLLGSKLNNVDSLIVRDREASALIHFNSLEEAKACFHSLYKILLAPSFKPSVPPSAEEIQYHQHFMMLVSFYPVVLEFDIDSYKNHLLKWCKKKQAAFCTEEKFFKAEYWHRPMLSGFLDTFGVLDITRDIERTPFIGPDGNMVLRINEVSHSKEGEPGQRPKPITQEEIEKILRERGYL